LFGVTDRRLLLGTAALASLIATPAHALCTYQGRNNFQTTIGQEFSDSRCVVRAKVLSAADGEVEAGKSDAGESWTTYRLRIIRTYKGDSLKQLKFFTMRNSGGFYMDRPWVDLPNGHDIGGEYLLFLNPIEAYEGQPHAERGGVFVNYNCGQSRPWAEISKSDRQQLERLAKR
jgi:hypothetical protein